jgi:hypothetical protein
LRKIEENISVRSIKESQGGEGEAICISYIIEITENWVDSATTYERPSFNGLPGFDINWDFDSGTLVSSYIFAYMHSDAGNISINGPPQVATGTVIHTAGQDVSFTP